jgi:hypothetical protein
MMKRLIEKRLVDTVGLRMRFLLCVSSINVITRKIATQFDKRMQKQDVATTVTLNFPNFSN